MTVSGMAVKFEFADIARSKQSEQNQGLVTSSMQGYLFSKKGQLMDYWRLLMNEDTWEPDFYVLTNVGLLVFKDDNFVNPLKLISVLKMTMVPVARRAGERDFVFKLTSATGEEMVLAAPDKAQFD